MEEIQLFKQENFKCIKKGYGLDSIEYYDESDIIYQLKKTEEKEKNNIILPHQKSEILDD